MQSRNREIDIENKCMVTKRGKGKWMNWDWPICTTLHKTGKWWELAAQHRELSSVLPPACVSHDALCVWVKWPGWEYTGLTCSFPDLEPVCCSMSSSNCCFLTCIQISQEAGKVVWYSLLLKNFPRFLVIHPVKGFGVVNKGKVAVFLKLSCFFNDPTDVGNVIPSPTWLIFMHS